MKISLSLLYIIHIFIYIHITYNMYIFIYAYAYKVTTGRSEKYPAVSLYENSFCFKSPPTLLLNQPDNTNGCIASLL